MSSGFLEIEGGTQPALPSTNRSRLWYNTSTNEWYVVFSDGTNKRITFPTSAQPNQVLIWNGTSWTTDNLLLPYRNLVQIYEDFISQNGNGALNLRATNLGGGVVTTDLAPINNIGNKIGLVRLTAAATNNTRSGIDCHGNGIFLLDNGVTIFRSSVFLSTNSLVPANNKVGMWGLGLNANQTVLNFARGCYFKVRASTNGSDVLAVCSESSVHTEVSMGPITENSWYTYEIEINSAGPTATFRVYQDGSNSPLYTTTINTNIPTGTTNFVEPLLYFSTQGGAGTAISYLYADYFELIKIFNTIR